MGSAGPGNGGRRGAPRWRGDRDSSAARFGSGHVVALGGLSGPVGAVPGRRLVRVCVHVIPVTAFGCAPMCGGRAFVVCLTLWTMFIVWEQAFNQPGWLEHMSSYPSSYLSDDENNHSCMRRANLKK